MKLLVVKKEFNGMPVGFTMGLVNEAPNTMHVNEGFIEAVEIPEGLDTNFLSVSYDLVPAYWSKSGQPNVSVQPTIQVNQPITEVDTSWIHHSAQPYSFKQWTKQGFATQYDQPPMIIVDDQEVEDTSWTFHPEVIATPEYWSKDGEENESIEPVIEIDNFVDVPDTSWTYHPEQMEWVLSEDTVKKAESVRVTGVQKYVKRIQYADILIAEIAQRNEAKVLTIPQIIEMNQVYSPIMQLLKSGSYGSARSTILAATPSAGITSEDITYTVGLIEAYLTNEAQNG